MSDEGGLPPALRARLERLQIRARRARRGSGTTRSRRLGAGVDFADRRPYSPGDDLRYVDWTLYARLDQMMIRLSEQEARKPVHLLVDLSRSMDLDVRGPTNLEIPGRDGAKARAARELAAALGYAALCARDPLRVWPYAGELGRPLVTARRRAEVVRVWRHLQAAELAPGSDLAGAAARLTGLARDRGVAIVVSDLLDDGWQRGLLMLRHAGFEPAVVHLQAPGERALPLRDRRFDLVDAETGEVLRGLGRAEVAALRAAPWGERVRAWCRRQGVPVVSVDLTARGPALAALVPMLVEGGILG